MSTTPTELANPNIGMDNFISGLQEAGMQQAAEAAKTEPAKPAEATIAPPEPPPKKEAPPAEKPAETPKETTKEQPKESDDDKWPRNAKDWDARKAAEKKRLEAKEAEILTIRTERDAIKAEIDQLKKSGPSPELEALKKEKAELDEQLKLVSVQNHPKFKAFFEKRVSDKIAMAKAIVGAEKAEQIAMLLASPNGPLKDRQIEEMAEGMTSLQQGRLSGIINDLEAIEAERQSEISKAQANYDTIQKQNAEAQEKQRKEYETQFDATVKAYSTNPAFQKKDGDVEWNAEVDRRIEAAKGIVFGNQKPEYVFKAAMDAVALPTVLRQLSDSMKTVESLNAQIAELKSSTPTVEPGKGKDTPVTTTSTTAPVNKPGHTDPMSAIGNWMTGMKEGME